MAFRGRRRGFFTDRRTGSDRRSGRERIMEAILKMTVVAAAGLLLAACNAPETPRPDPYVGRSVSDLAVRFGPPDIQFEAGKNQRAFIWTHFQEPGTAAIPAVNRCRLWAVAHSLHLEGRASPTGLPIVGRYHPAKTAIGDGGGWEERPANHLVPNSISSTEQGSSGTGYADETRHRTGIRL